MLVYIFMFIIFTSIAFLDITNMSKKNKKMLIVLCGISLIFTSGIRWNVGADWSPYFDFFSENQTWSQFIYGDFEFGYAILNYLVRVLTDEYTVFLFCMIALIVCLKFETLYNYTPFPLLALLLNFSSYVGDVFFVRQTIAMAIIFYSFKFIVEKRLGKFICSIFLASSIHFSAIVFIFAYYIYYLKINVKLLSIFMILSINIAYFDLMNELIFFISTIGDVGKNIFIMKFIGYINLQEAGVHYGNIDPKTSLITGCLRRMIIVAVLLYYKKEISDRYNEYKGILNLLIFELLLFAIIYPISPVISRITGYYALFSILIIPSLFYVPKTIFGKLTFLIILIIYCAAKYINVIYDHYDHYVPFTTIFT